MVVYKITNTENGKCYIGQTTQKFSHRVSEHKHRALFQKDRTHKLYMAIRKYGIDAFIWQVLHVCNDRDEMNRLEIEYIGKFNSFNRGYNMTIGGDSVSDETREKLRNIFLGRKITWHQKIVDARRRNGTLYGFPQAKGNESKLSKLYIVTLPTGEGVMVRGLRAWCREHGLSHSGMIDCAKGRRSNHHNHLCRYADNNVQRPAERRTPERVETGVIPTWDGDMVCSAAKVAAVAYGNGIEVAILSEH
jgi:hypothetical protein